MIMKEKTFQGMSPAGFHRVAYTDWGATDGRGTVVCVHGLTRNGRDFDKFAAALAGDFRIVCPDVVGRGRSDWLPNGSLYGFPQYLSDMVALVARLDVEEVDWVGTSMGGLIGMMLAAQPNTPVRRLVLNDVGPFIPKEALERIGGYIAANPVFDDLAAVESHLRTIYDGFGILSDEDWRMLAHNSARPLPDGHLTFAYDPAIGAPFENKPLQDIDLWAIWDAVRCPVLVVRGAMSDMLTAETASEMSGRGPGATVIDIPGAGHAPSLMTPEQITIVRDFLDGDGR